MTAPTYRLYPYRDVEDINRRFGQLIQTLFGDASGLTGSVASPPVDIEEREDAYVVDVDLPNVRPEDVNIEMRGEELRISGRIQQRESTGIVRRQNRPTGEFEYVVDLPGDIDTNRVEATYDNGVLTITVGKAQDAQPRRIEVRDLSQQRLGDSDGQSEAQPAAGAGDQADGRSGGQSDGEQSAS
jgi:HSP20 family protein